MGSHVDYRAPSLSFVGLVNIEGSNESDNAVEEENNSYNIREVEDTSQISLVNDMDITVMDSDNENSDDYRLVPYDDTREIYITEDNITTDSESENDENITHAKKKIKLDIKEETNNGPEPESTDVANKCPICLEAWNSSGKHRLCSLRCGHLFGYDCIKLWLYSDNNGAKNCPQCHAKASIRHIRILYANKLTSLDNSEMERMKEELKQVRLRESQVLKALMKEKEKSRKYKQMYKARTLAITTDSDFCFSD